MTNLLLRPAAEQDAAPLAELLNAIIATGRDTTMVEPVTVDEQLAFLRDLPAASVCTVAVERTTHRVVGVQDVLPLASERALAHVGVISTFVALDHHRRGVGRALTRLTLQLAASHGYRKVMATIRADNPRAVSFYESQGFAVVGTARAHAFVGGRYIDEIIAERQLVSAATPRIRPEG